MRFKNLSLFPSSSHLESADAWFTPGRFAALLALLIFIFFPDVILGTRTFIFRDFGAFGYPIAFYHRQSFWRGEVPLLNPLNNCGLPFLAQWNTIVLYPGSLFYLLFPLSWSLGVFCLVHLFLAGLGMYFLAHRWTGNRLAASVAGLAFAFNGFTLSCLIWPHCMASLGWMPFVVLTAESAWQKGGRFVVAAAVIGALQMLAGPPEFILSTWLVVGSLWLGHCAFGKLPVWDSLKRMGFVVLTITALSGAQLFPFFELLEHSQRGSSYGTGEWSMPPTGWANLLVPLFYCFKTPAGPYVQHDQYMVSSYYLGVSVLALALFAVCQLREWRVWLLGGIAALSLILALGNAGYLFGWLRRILPLLGFMRFPVKFVMLTAFTVPLLAACGARKLLCPTGEEQARSWRFLAVLWLTMTSLVFLILWFARDYPEGAEPWADTARNGLERVAFLSLTVGVLYRLSRARDALKQVVLGVGLLALLWLDVVTHAPPQNPTVPRSVYEPGLQPVQQLKPRPTLGESRAALSFSAVWQFHSTMLSDPFKTYLGDRLGLFSNCNLLELLPKVDGFYSLYVEEEFEARTLLYLSADAFIPEHRTDEYLSREYRRVSTNNFATNLADFLGVCQMTAPGELFQWRARPTCLPLLTASQRPVFVVATNSLRALLDFNPRQVVYLPLDAKPFITVSNETQARIVSRQFSAHRVRLEVEAEQPSMVVAAQTFYPCWRAYVDDHPVRLWRANYAFQALQVPVGSHKVQLVFQDRTFFAGLAISVATLLACIAGMVRRQRISGFCPHAARL